jgi:hypothetical protein
LAEEPQVELWQDPLHPEQQAQHPVQPPLPFFLLGSSALMLAATSNATNVSAMALPIIGDIKTSLLNLKS